MNQNPMGGMGQDFNKIFKAEKENFKVEPQAYPPLERMEAQVARLKTFKAERSQAEASRALDAMARAANSKDENVFEKLVEAAYAGATHGEICAGLRRELGFGEPLVLA